jgi:hypothetical protein
MRYIWHLSLSRFNSDCGTAPQPPALHYCLEYAAEKRRCTDAVYLVRWDLAF